ncbi:MAG: HAD hydrolase family protein [Ruminococcus sp.]
MIVFDIDGTLVDDDGSIPASTIQQLLPHRKPDI